jgi:hypothetical protein
MFRSTLPPWLLGTKRRELTRVSVRVPKKGFRPRRFAIVEPTKNADPPFVAGENVEMFDGICSMASEMLTMPRFWRSAASMVVTRLGET